MPPLIALGCALFFLVYRVIRQVLLPTFVRKGNLLSSLFLLFTGLTEHLIGFGEAVGRVPRTIRKPFAGQETLLKAWTFSRKYLRQGLLIATWALFVLSSLEWSGRTTTVDTAASTSSGTVAATGTAASGQQAIRQTETRVVADTHARPERVTPSRCALPSLHADATPLWLRWCTLRL
ncbi:hypothetical protein EDB95_4554 [Dinghuibacter silviterrae]|uniref:Uncharacterized protein n=1 Tax=Dinghuibacter silviterrae TaxID=1539049 RepID=A0A4R8DH34_9BACT|nr:hypothetical protein EDB95_4554 [Dinghuibacter silviterrae]